MAFNDLRNNPSPPIANTSIVINSKAVIALKLKRIDEITPKMSATSEPIVNNQPMMFLLLKR